MRGETFAAFREIVRRIPAGKVATYGQIAHLAGRPRCARAVGRAMAGCQDPSVPCHRVFHLKVNETAHGGRRHPRSASPRFLYYPGLMLRYSVISRG